VNAQVTVIEGEKAPWLSSLGPPLIRLDRRGARCLTLCKALNRAIPSLSARRRVSHTLRGLMNIADHVQRRKRRFNTDSQRIWALKQITRRRTAPCPRSSLRNGSLLRAITPNRPMILITEHRLLAGFRQGTARKTGGAHFTLGIPGDLAIAPPAIMWEYSQDPAKPTTRSALAERNLAADAEANW